ncbi:N-acetyl sugar amidotransferase [Flavobacteriaceae bacterium]|nr:N-acetyl sugar amidotransferase [Flavobacteriaceae bacterium]
MTNQQICTTCVMDISDPEITFNEAGVCNHCLNFENTKKNWFPNKEGQKKLEAYLSQIKKSCQNQEYDCIIGLSGGIDSTYLALKAKDWGLRPLVIHVDAGWNSELAVSNIEKIVKHCNYDLHTEVIDWTAMKNLHLAYLKSGISNQDVPQDHIFFSTLYHYATKNNIKYILSGGNIATESIFPASWHGSAMDAINLKAIYKRFGQTKSLKNYKTINFFKYYIYFPFVYRMRVLRPLNFMPYDKREALKELEQIGYKKYVGKHGESIFTKFFQTYYLPKKFGCDKRRPHLSSLIVSGQLTREEALIELDKPLYSSETIKNEKAYIAKKLGLSLEGLDELIENKNHVYSDFPNWMKYLKLIRFLSRLLNKMIGYKIKVNY